MNKQIEALKMAIEALDNACMKIEKWTKGGKWTAGKDALNACKEALAEAEKQEWKSLSDDEIRDIYKNYQRGYYEEDFFNFARAIEQALKEKNHAD